MATIRDLLVRIGVDADSRQLTQVDKNLMQFKRNVRKVTVALGVFAGATATAFGFLAKGAGEMEQTEIAFSTMLGSAEKATKLLKDIKQFAAKTPFNLVSVINYSKQLIGANVAQEDIIDSLRTMGNIAAGVGRDKLPTLIRAYSKIKSKGKATLEELNMLTEAGVPILDALAKQFNVSKEAMFKMISTGQISFKSFNKALNDLSTTKFAGLMDKLSKTFLGIWSNIQDVLEQVRIEVGKKLLPEATKTFKGMLNWLDRNKKSIVELSGIIIRVLIPALKVVLKILAGIAGVAVLAGIGKLILMLGSLRKAFILLGNSALLAKAKALLLPILVGAAFVALGLIIEDVIAHFQGKKSITGLVLDAFEKKFPDAFKTTTKIFRGFADILKKSFEVLKGFVRILLGLFVGDKDTIIQGIDEISEALTNLFKTIAPDSFARLERFMKALAQIRTGQFAAAISTMGNQLGGFGGEITPVTFGANGATRQVYQSVNNKVGDILINAPAGANAEDIAIMTRNEVQSLLNEQNERNYSALEGQIQ